MKSKINVEDGEGPRKGNLGGAKLESSPVRTGGRGARQNTSVAPRPGKRSAGGPNGGASPSPAPAVRTPLTGTSSGPGPGRTPTTKRRELSLTSSIVEKNSPSGSPRSGKTVNTTVTGNTRKSGQVKSSTAKSENREVNQNNNSSSYGPHYEESSRKSSASSQDSGIGRESKLSVRTDRTIKVGSKTSGRGGPAPPPTIRIPDMVDLEVSNRQKFSELCDVKNVEMGIVKVPPELLEDLIHKENIEKFYDVDPVPVASGLFATVRKCTNKETGIEYAAKFSSRTRCGVDCTTEVLHEIALLSICSESNKIVHLKDVFQNQHEIVLVLEYAPGGDFQSVLDDDMVPFEQDVQGFMLQLLEAISYVHERNIAHLDIKPQNIVLMSEFPNCEIKLCDLEVSRVIQEGEYIREIIGTPDYVAPEILAYEPISLAADIWSLGVLAYVLLTGFSPFGGDTDQETLRNISTASLDFPSELFEGVSDEAKDFIADCLQRDPKKRLSVDQCLTHPWIAANSEPPSPSPLMLKIPAPEHHFVTSHHGTSQAKLSVHSGGAGGSRRSCQTCRDKLTERKRYLSKSREAIFEKVANSNLKKSLSKSRERLCDMRMTLSKSRDYLNETKLASRSQEKFFTFKSLSKSQEVLSQALGGNMKRMVNGAVSDISPAHLPINPRVYLDPPSDNFDNFLIIPGSSVLMSHSDLHLLGAISESGRSTPASVCSTTTLADSIHSESCNDHPPSAKPETLIEVSEDDCDDVDNKAAKELSNNESKVDINKDETNHVGSLVERRSDSRGNSSNRGSLIKEEKDNLNYETKQSMSRATSVDRIVFSPNITVSNRISPETAEVATQVDLTKSPPTKIKSEEENNNMNDSGLGHVDPPSITSLRIPVDGNMRGEKKLTRGFSHDDTLGDDQKRYSWREELEKFKQTKKSFGVSDLIDAFSNKSPTRKVSADDPSFPNVDSLKNKRRGSLQIQIDSNTLARLAETAEKNEKAKNAIKLQRRKSTSAIIPLRLNEIKMPNIDEDSANIIDKIKADSLSKKGDKYDIERGTDVIVEGELTDQQNCKSINTANAVNQSSPKGRTYLEKVNERKRTWDYFEINHPKAISDKKLEQLKAKYTRRKTETSLQTKTESPLKDKNGNDKPKGEEKKTTLPSPNLRTVSMPLIEGLKGIEKTIIESRPGLELAWDPLTGECVEGPKSLGQGQDTESVDSGQESEPKNKSTPETELNLNPLKEELSCKTYSRKNSHVGNIKETDEDNSDSNLPSDHIIECFIDPFTGQFITNEVSKQNNGSVKKGLTVAADGKPEFSGQQDDGIGSLPDTPTDSSKTEVFENTSVNNNIEDVVKQNPIITTNGDHIPDNDSAFDRASDKERLRDK